MISPQRGGVYFETSNGILEMLQGVIVVVKKNPVSLLLNVFYTLLMLEMLRRYSGFKKTFLYINVFF